MTDAAGGAPAAVTMTAERPWMPLHGHGATTFPLVTPGAPGVFTVSGMSFFMAGYWEVKLDLQPTSGAADKLTFAICVPAVTAELESARDPDRINFDWLLRLRWAAIAGQLITIGAVHFAMQLDIPLAPLLALVGVEIGSNLACALLARRHRPRQAWLAAVMGLDVLLFSGLLYLTGGPLNPFSFLYLIPIALASITVRPAWTWALVVLSLACSAFLFAASRAAVARRSRAPHEPPPARHVGGVRRRRVVHRLLLAARAARAGAARARARRRAGGGPRQEKLASLATLAAGAAHELLTPLSTIAVIAGDLQRDLAQAGDVRPRRRGRAAGARRGRSLPRDHRAHARRRGRHGGRRVRGGSGRERWSRPPWAASRARASPCVPRSPRRSSIAC